jgi:hypothetical protein
MGWRNFVGIFNINPKTNPKHKKKQAWTLSSDVCKAGEYIGADPTDSTPIQCPKCKTSCSAGFYMQGSCQGNNYMDTIDCIPCKSCDTGKYRSSLDLCNGSTTADTVQCTDCRY